jgi:hypothetical protein
MHRLSFPGEKDVNRACRHLEDWWKQGFRSVREKPMVGNAGTSHGSRMKVDAAEFGIDFTVVISPAAWDGRMREAKALVIRWLARMAREVEPRSSVTRVA